MKKLVFLLMLVFSFPLSAQLFSAGKDWQLTLEPRLGITYGKLGEYLYMQKNDGTWKKNSYLEWEEKPLFTAGLSVAGQYKRFGLQTYADIAYPRRSGKMYDSDWKLGSQPTVKTNYSIHEETSPLNIDTGLRFSCAFYPHKTLSLAPTVDAEYSYKKFEARNGYGWYGDSVPWQEGHYYPDGKYILGAIDYCRHSLYIFSGVTATLQGTERLRIAISLFVAPFTYAYAEDKHYTNKKRTEGRYYVDIQASYFDRFKGEVAVFYAVTPWLEVGLSANGLVGGFSKGDIYDEDPDTEKRYFKGGYQSGFSIFEASVRLSARVRVL